MNKKKIAVFIDWYLPGTKAGGPVRSVFSLVSLLRNEFDFYIITTNHDLGSTSPYDGITANTIFEKDHIKYFYFDKEFQNTNNHINLINEIKPDLIYLNSFWSFNFSINLIRLKNRQTISTPILLAPRGMLGKGAMGLKSFKKNLFVLFAKTLNWYKDISFHATQIQEKKDIQAKFKSAQVVLAPNVNSGTVIKNTSEKPENHLKLFYLSRIAKVKNLHFALEVLKEIPAEYKVEYDIFGNKEDVEYWNYCESIIASLPSNISVKQVGEIKFDEVQSKIKNYNLLFLPTLNENFGHSIVESLLCGCPVIISDQTPWNDLAKFNAGFALDLNAPEKFKEAIIYYSKLNQEDFNQASSNAINYISNKINLDDIVKQYKQLFNDSIKNRPIHI